MIEFDQFKKCWRTYNTWKKT